MGVCVCVCIYVCVLWGGGGGGGGKLDLVKGLIQVKWIVLVDSLLYVYRL